jgi:hypothetical protein
MRIYVDNCVFQLLKCENKKDLFELIISGKGENQYFFSEAHLQDLSRDKTLQKEDDLVFIEGIVDNNCLWFKDKELYNYYTPTDCYKSFDWSDSRFLGAFNLFNGDLFKNLLESMPLNLSEIISLDKLPKDIPLTFVEMLNKPTNFYEFCIGLFDFSTTLSTEQKKYKEFLQYLHANSLSAKLYEKSGIEGYDGIRITDKELFKESLFNLNILNQKDRNHLDKYLSSYNALEIFGIVPGKPKKQQLINMLNDSKHSFFGRNCDIVVSIDEDFIKKSKFMYDLLDIDTIVLNLSEFESLIKEQIRFQTNELDSLFAEITKEDKHNNYLLKNEENGMIYFVEDLNRMFLGYFNQIIRSTDGSIFVTKNIEKSYFKSTFFKEIEHCVNMLFERFGLDINSKGKYDLSSDGNYSIRTWIICDGELELNLIYDSKVYLIISRTNKTDNN